MNFPTNPTFSSSHLNLNHVSFEFYFEFVKNVIVFRHIKAIVYNKTRKYAGHTVDLNLGDNATVAEVNLLV